MRNILLCAILVIIGTTTFAQKNKKGETPSELQVFIAEKPKIIDSLNLVFSDELKKAALAYEKAVNDADKKYQKSMQEIEIKEKLLIEKSIVK